MEHERLSEEQELKRKLKLQTMETELKITFLSENLVRSSYGNLGLKRLILLHHSTRFPCFNTTSIWRGFLWSFACHAFPQSLIVPLCPLIEALTSPSIVSILKINVIVYTRTNKYESEVDFSGRKREKKDQDCKKTS